MFREMRRIKQQLPEGECFEILKTETRGVLSLIGDFGYPYGVPVNFYLSDDNKIYFHGAKQGHKIDAIKNDNKVCFTVYTKGVQSSTKPGLDVKSVIVFGKIKIVEDKNATVEICRKLAYRFPFADKNYIEDEIKNFSKFVCVLELIPEHITGKIINES